MKKLYLLYNFSKLLVVKLLIGIALPVAEKG